MSFSGEFSATARFYGNEIMSELVNRDWRLPPRPWGELFERFTLPKRTLKAIGTRMYINLNYYQTNYIFILAVTLIVFLLRHRWSIFVVVAITAGWVYATSTKPIIFRGKRITRKQRFYFMGVATFILPLITGVTKHGFKYFIVALTGKVSSKHLSLFSQTLTIRGVCS